MLLSFRTFFLILVSSLCSLPASEITNSTLKRMRVLNHETGYYGGYVDQSLTRCSEFQDLWLYYLHNVESTKEYYRGMELLYPYASSFRTNVNYVSEVVNFFNPGGKHFLRPQELRLGMKGDIPLYGFLNTFKTGRELSSEERGKYWLEESERYHRDAVEWPFCLNSETLNDLQSETVYNFALHADGSIWAALERPGPRAYYVQEGGTEHEEAFTHPNHTILARRPQQVLLTGGSFLFYELGDRRLYFISNKSGHFVPYFCSLDRMVDALADLGVNRYTVICVPDLDLASVALKLYRGVQVPLILEKERIKRLFQRAQDAWIKTLDSIDLDFLAALASGDLAGLTPERVQDLNRQREEAAYMRSACHLFLEEHEAPKHFHTLVKRFGRLKDAIRHGVAERIQPEAAAVFRMLQTPSYVLREGAFRLAEGNSIAIFLTARIAAVRELLAYESLSADDFHTVKKWSRELAVLFNLLAEDSFNQGKNYFLFKAVAKEFFYINEIMAEVHDNCVRGDMWGEAVYEEMTVAFPSKVVDRMERLLDRLRIPPPAFSLDIPNDETFWLINCAKTWYHWHYRISAYPSGRTMDNYDPRARLLLERIVAGDFRGLENEDDDFAEELLATTLHTAEYARAALIFIDSCHEADAKIDDYIHALRQVLHWIRHGGKQGVVDDAARMLQYMQDRGIPSRQLENYVCTDQQGFDRVLSERLASLDVLITHENLPLSTLLAIREYALQLRDILELFRHAGVKYQSYPMVCYDEAKDAAEKLVDAIDATLLPNVLDMSIEFPVTKSMAEDAQYLRRKLIPSPTAAASPTRNICG